MVQRSGAGPDGARRSNGGRLARNTGWNLLGQMLSLPMALVAIPLLIAALGTERFGILMMAWLAIGYFGLFDLGLGQALSKLMVERLGSAREQELPGVVWTALALMAALGLLASLLLAALATPLVTQVLSVPPQLHGEAIASFRWIAVGLPFVTVASGLTGMLAARQRFDLLGATRLLTAAVTYLGPLAILPFSISLSAVTGVLVLGRVSACVIHLLLCLRIEPALRRRPAYRQALVRQLLRFGGWVTVSGVLGPIMVTADRFFVGAWVSMAAVAYYATPYEVITKLGMIPGALSGVLFVAFAAPQSQDAAAARLLFDRGIKGLFLILFPLVVVVVAAAQPALALWLGPDFARHSYRVLQWLAVGVFVNSLAQIPFVLLQGRGRPDIPARLHLVELPLYLVAAFVLIAHWGLEGAAMAWTARVALDALLLYAAAWRLLGTGAAAVLRALLAALSTVAPFALCALPMEGGIKAAVTAGVLAGFAAVAWRMLLSPGERAAARRWLARRPVDLPRP